MQSGKQLPGMGVSVVIPARNEEHALPGTLRNLLGQQGDFEVILVDGASSDGTLDIANRWKGIFRDSGRRFVVRGSKPGRAVQLNLGARQAKGDVLLFLHADTHLPEGAILRIRKLLEDNRIIGGGFALRFQENDPWLRWVSVFSTLRGAGRRCFFGDQGLFVRRAIFESLEGFRLMPFLEDLDFAKRLRRAGRVGFIPLPVRTSGRRFLQVGLLRSLGLIGWAKLFYSLGFVPDFLCRRYNEIR